MAKTSFIVNDSCSFIIYFEKGKACALFLFSFSLQGVRTENGFTRSKSTGLCWQCPLFAFQNKRLPPIFCQNQKNRTKTEAKNRTFCTLKTDAKSCILILQSIAKHATDCTASNTNVFIICTYRRYYPCELLTRPCWPNLNVC